MTQVDKIRIFLASPSDVPRERKIVEDVVQEFNKIHPSRKTMVLELITSKDVLPKFGADGQTIVNRQIGPMREYDLFIGIMNARIGTPTRSLSSTRSRSISGTVEEFTRAERQFNKSGFPEISFYFREKMPIAKNKDEEKQQSKVKKFNDKLSKKSFARSYRNTTVFETMIRALILDLISNSKNRPRRKVAKQIPPKKLEVVQSSRSISSPSKWVMLDDTFFQTSAATKHVNDIISLHVITTDSTLINKLKTYGAHNRHNQRVAFADSRHAGNVEIQSVATEYEGEKTTIKIELRLLEVHRNWMMNNIQYGSIKPQEVATLQIRALLLGEALPQDHRNYVPYPEIIDFNNRRETLKNSVFPDLWKRLNETPTVFLPKAWLQAKYYLTMTHVVDTVDELKLGLVSDKTKLNVQFKGTRKRTDGTKNGDRIEITGECLLE